MINFLILIFYHGFQTFSSLIKGTTWCPFKATKISRGDLCMNYTFCRGCPSSFLNLSCRSDEIPISSIASSIVLFLSSITILRQFSVKSSVSCLAASISSLASFLADLMVVQSLLLVILLYPHSRHSLKEAD